MYTWVRSDLYLPENPCGLLKYKQQLQPEFQVHGALAWAYSSCDSGFLMKVDKSIEGPPGVCPQWL